MLKNRWNSGLAQSVSNGAPGSNCYSNDRADMIEALIETAEELIAVLQPADVSPGANEVEALLHALQRHKAAITRAKNWK